MVCLSIALSSRAAEPDPLEAARAMVEAERKFYQTGQEKGTRAAFLAFLADDGIVFRPGPLNGKEVWGKRPETGFDLVWEPTFAAMSRSADFGYDTGPARWRANKKEEKFTGHGQFVSIWKKQKDGSWKVALDLGIENPEPPGKIEALRIVEPEKEAAGPTDPAARKNALQKEQNAFVALAKLDFTKAFRNAAANEVRLYRDGSFPALGQEAATRLLGPEQAGVTMEIMKGDISGSADLAYHYGKYTDGRPQGATTGHFFQIWQTDATGSWKLVLDWQQPLPKK
ncbi:MAG TPA: nuclear transport factor 2 family protein [Chthoniobacterales bacterium]|nr:nuclear transport factor 2 family protein [Chthoniobacterales bacterium]